MTLTKRQVEALLTAPFEEYGGDEECWDVESDGEGRLEVIWGRFTLRRYSRFIALNGDVERWDEEPEEFVPATFEPLIGQYFSRNPDGAEIRHTYRY